MLMALRAGVCSWRCAPSSKTLDKIAGAITDQRAHNQNDQENQVIRNTDHTPNSDGADGAGSGHQQQKALLRFARFGFRQ
jgi:hypothetical protein